MFNLLKKPTKSRAVADRLLASARQEARNPTLFGDDRVPDTLDGRFESMVLHVALLVIRLQNEGEDAASVSQELFNALFYDLDSALREIGVGDLIVPKRIGRMGDAFYGRLRGYKTALEEGDEALADALRRNLLATGAPSDAFVAAATRYVRETHESLSRQSLTALTEDAEPAWSAFRL